MLKSSFRPSVFLRWLSWFPLLPLWILAAVGNQVLDELARSSIDSLQQSAIGAFSQRLQLAGMAIPALPVAGKSGKQSSPPAADVEGLEYGVFDARRGELRVAGAQLSDKSLEERFGAEAQAIVEQVLRRHATAVMLTPAGQLLGATPLRTAGAPTNGGPPILVARDDLQPHLDALSRKYQNYSRNLVATTLALSLAIVLNAGLLARRERQTTLAAGEERELAQRMLAANRDLAASEARLNFALHGSNAGIWDWDMDSAHTYYSPRWKTLLGYAGNEVLPHAEEWLKRVHPDDLPRVMQLLNEHVAGEKDFFESEHRLRRKDGSYIWVLERGTAIREQHGRAVRMVGALIDISRRKEIESELQKSEAEYRSVVDGVTQIIFRSDDLGRLTFLNPAWTELTGFPVEASLARPMWDFAPADEREQLRALFVPTGHSCRDKVQAEFRLFTRDSDGHWFSLHARDVGYGMAGVVTDIDAQKSAQSALAHSNSERKAILELSPAGFVFVDAGRRIAYANAAFLSMTGLDAEQLAGLDLAALQQRIAPLCDSQRPPPVFADALDDREQTLLLDRPEKRVVKWLFRNLRDEWDDSQGGVFFFRDVTRESEIDRMKTEFLSTAAHELRTPMASIFGFSELLLARDFDPETRQDLIQTIHRQTRNLMELLNELLDLARIEARGGKGFRIEELPLKPIILDATASLYVPAETHRLEVDLPTLLPKVNVDVEKFGQCLANVLSNAIKYSPDGGLIHISTSTRTAGDGQALVGVTVSDEGIGMTEDQVAHMFDRFYRAEGSRHIPGTGLGMALVKETMEILGGEVSVESSFHFGTAVTLWLPFRPHEPVGRAEEWPVKQS